MNTIIDFSMLLPAPCNNYAGPTLAVWFLVIINTIGTIRSLIHMFFHDGGAQSIATMNLNVSGSQNIVAIFGQWGGMQLIMAFFIWIILWRYREFVPLMIGEVLIEQLVRISIGHLKPTITTGTPPGRTGSMILLPVSIIMLIISLMRNTA
ncbi:unnamed protein product [Rotaria socialis]|uniref:Uncharacterized protein n=1 Tax=Rotaria socialis TaxID=392032 RepID=A0A821RZP7_9BILA|nr:unnamed protein product [Rotaria socialis]CAF4847076.1 unnamed protein product [Rotaria socialis]